MTKKPTMSQGTKIKTPTRWASVHLMIQIKMVDYQIVCRHFDAVERDQSLFGPRFAKEQCVCAYNGNDR